MFPSLKNEHVSDGVFMFWEGTTEIIGCGENFYSGTVLPIYFDGGGQKIHEYGKDEVM